MEKLNWGFKWKSGDEKKLISGESIPESMKKLLGQALTTETRLAAESMKLIKKIGDSDAQFKVLKSGYTEAQKHIQDIKHIQDFKELPGSDSSSGLSKESFDRCMAQALVLCYGFVLDVGCYWWHI